MSISEPKMERMRLDELARATYNPRRIRPEALAGLEASLQRFGLVQPIIVNVHDGRKTVVGGHQRLTVLEARGVEETSVLVVDLPPVEERALNLALNNPHIAGEFVEDELLALLDQIQDADADLYDALRLQDLEADFNDEEEAPFDGKTEPDEIPEQVAHRVQPGELWQLGEHRLYCGDSTDVRALRFFKEDIADFVFTSPPYNAGSNHLSGNLSMRDSRYMSTKDNLDDCAFNLILSAVVNNVIGLAKCVCVNLQMLASNKLAVIEFLAQFKTKLIDIAIWDKETAPPCPAQGVMSSQFEFLIFLSSDDMPTRSIPGSSFLGTVSNVYAGPPQRTNEFHEVHAATFPVHLPHWAIESFTSAHATVLDPFGGTGTTLIACQIAGRRCRMVEIDPAYCDVILARWERFTGQTAERIETNESRTDLSIGHFGS